MRKSSLVISVFLALAVIVTGAFLPRLTTTVMDRSTLHIPATAPMTSVELTLKDAASLSILQKMKLYGSMSSIPISSAEASMSAEQVHEAVRQQMKLFELGDVFQWFDADYSSAETYLAMNPNDTSQFSIFWTVSYSTNQKPYYSYIAHVDDATGKLFLINYTAPEFSKLWRSDESKWAAFETLSSVYFSQLELPSTTRNPYIQKMEEKTTDYGAFSVTYLLDVPDVGSFCVEIRISPGEYYIGCHE